MLSADRLLFFLPLYVLEQTAGMDLLLCCLLGSVQFMGVTMGLPSASTRTHIPQPAVRVEAAVPGYPVKMRWQPGSPNPRPSPLVECPSVQISFGSMVPA